MKALHQRMHGGPDGLGAPLHDFSTNSNACGPCPQALAAVQGADATRYPDALYTDLRAQLAAWHGVAMERVLLAASASEFIFRITAWVAQQGGGSVWLPSHSYGDYASAAQTWGMQRVDDALEAALRWACDPSSPLGQAQPLRDAWQEGGGVGVLDRAYEPLRLNGALALPAAQLDKVWQLWTPNKALGLTGVRAAYVIAPLDADDAVAALERLCPSWPMGAHGVAMLQAWVQPQVQAWLGDSLQTLRAWKARQLALCESLGWNCLPSEANFFCARTDRSASALPQALHELRAQGIKLRDAASFGLSGHVRLGVLPPASQDALAQAWRGLRQGAGAPIERANA
jgi:histidinol-phosphate aminotransferase